MYIGSYVVNLLKHKAVSQKNHIFAPVTLHNKLFVIGSLTIFTAQIAALMPVG